MITLEWIDVISVFLGGAAFSLWSFFAYSWMTGRILDGKELAIVQEVMKRRGLNRGTARKFIINEYARLSGIMRPAGSEGPLQGEASERQ